MFKNEIVEKILVEDLLRCLKASAYNPDEFNLLEDVHELNADSINSVRETHAGCSVASAYELKTYYADKGLESATLTLKLKDKFSMLKVTECVERKLHAVEVVYVHGKYKVLDVNHSDKTVWLETYLDTLCEINNISKEDLTYDILCYTTNSSLSDNNGILTDLAIWLDTIYKIGSSPVSLLNIDSASIERNKLGFNFEELASLYNTTTNDIVELCGHVYKKLVRVFIGMSTVRSIVPNNAKALKSKMFDFYYIWAAYCR